jgi:hypothetical protein
MYFILAFLLFPRLDRQTDARLFRWQFSELPASDRNREPSPTGTFKVTAELPHRSSVALTASLFPTVVKPVDASGYDLIQNLGYEFAARVDCDEGYVERRDPWLSHRNAVVTG